MLPILGSGRDFIVVLKAVGGALDSFVRTFLGSLGDDDDENKPHRNDRP